MSTRPTSRRLRAAHLMVAVASSWVAGCLVALPARRAQVREQAPEASPAAAEPRPTPLPVTASSLEALTFSRLVVRLPGDSEIRVSGEEYRVRMLEELRKAGYPARGAESLVFEKDKSDEARFVLGGTINEVDCRPAKDADRRCLLGVQWELLDKGSDRVVYRVQTRFATAGSDPRRMADDLVWGAFYSLLARPKFIEVMKKTSGAAEPTARTTSAKFRRCGEDPRPMPTSSDAVLQATVVVESGSKMGSGAVVSPDGLVLTAAHVLTPSAATYVQKRSGEKLTAVVVRVDEHADVALLRVESGAPHGCLSLRTETMGMGEEVYAIGSPLSRDLSFTLTRGIVSGFRELDGVQLVQTDASVNRGNSGGPIVDAQGRSAAVVSWKAFGTGVEGIAFGVPSGSALSALGLEPSDATDVALLSSPGATLAAPAAVADDTADPMPELDRRPAEGAERHPDPKGLRTFGWITLTGGAALVGYGAVSDGDDKGSYVASGVVVGLVGAVLLGVTVRPHSGGAQPATQQASASELKPRLSAGLGRRSVALRLDF